VGINHGFKLPVDKCNWFWNYEFAAIEAVFEGIRPIGFICFIADLFLRMADFSSLQKKTIIKKR